MQSVLDQVLDIYRNHNADADYFLSLVLFHEDMHDEAIGYTRQTLGYAKPLVEDGPQTRRAVHRTDQVKAESELVSLGDALIPGGRFVLGSTPAGHFVFDNEMDAHDVELEPFSISRTAVTNADFAAFVDDHG